MNEVTLEKKLGDIVPDIILNINGQKLMVEIGVTHFIDDIKGEKIKELGISTVEIDLSGLAREKIDFKVLSNILVEQIDSKTWIYNAKLKELYLNKYNELKAEEEKLRGEWEKIERKKREEREQRELFYQDYKKIITIRHSKKQHSFNGEVWHVDACPLKKNTYHFGGGVVNYYANVHIDCFNCPNFRGFRNRKTSIVCLAEYYEKKKNAGTSKD